MRPALVPTAAADVLAAAAVAGGAPLVPVLSATLGSACLYSGGMIQNDWCDRERDAHLHPGRPLIVDPGLSRRALLAMLLLFGAGLALCSGAGAAWAAGTVLVLASTYNLGAKQKFPWDAITLGAARSANLMIGLSVARAPLNAGTLSYLLGYLLFVGGITAASRTEEMEPPQTRRLGLLLAFVPMLIGLGALASLATESRILFLALFALLLFFLAQAMAAGSRTATQRYVLRCLLSIFLVHATCLWTRGGRASLLAIAACAGLSFLLLAPTSRPGSP